MKQWMEHVRSVVPYTPGEQPNEEGMIKLNTNENPYPPSPRVAEAIRQIKAEQLRLYPDPSAQELVRAIAQQMGVEENQVFAGVGSDDVLAMAFLTFFNAKEPILFPEISYSFYEVWADLFRIPYRKVALDEKMEIRADDYCEKNGGIIFPNPNAPTGCALPLDAVEKIVSENPGSVVIVDEAYVDFGAESAVALIGKYDNLLVVQTFSKSRSMAGARIGFALGNEALIRALSDVKYSFNSYTMSRMTIEAGKAAIEDRAYFLEHTAKIIHTRERAKEEFQKLGFSFPDSRANFLFVTHPRISAKALYLALRSRHIYVRYFDKPKLSDYLRVTIGTDEEMQSLFDFLKDFIGNNKEIMNGQ